MKKIFYFVVILTVFSLVSCYSEDLLMPTPAENADRFTFPQGTNSYDNEAKEIYNKFGVKIIYKNFRDVDFNLSWTNPGVGKVGYDIPPDEEKNAVEFMVHHIFKHLTPNVTKKILPPFFYVADSVYQYTRLDGEEGNYIESITGNPYIYGGYDYWSFCWSGINQYVKFNTEIMSQTPPIKKPESSWGRFYRRGVVLKEVYKKAVANGNIIAPEGFDSGFDFKTAIKYAKGTEGDINYYKTRGFPGRMTGANDFILTNITNVNQTGSAQTFTDYILLCMRYEPDSIEILFPKANHPMIHQKYPIVINHMKNNYDIDLSAIAAKP